MTDPSTWTAAQAEGYAEHYASAYPVLRNELRALESLRDQLRQYMQLIDCDSLIDGETGLGVELAPAATQTTWDVRSMPDGLVLSLQRRGLLTIVTTAFDALRKAAGGADLDAANRYRIRGERERAVKVIGKG